LVSAMAAVARHPLSLMSCVREPPPSSPTSSSPPDPFGDHKKCSAGAGSSFRPLRGLRRIFRRKPRATAPAAVLAPPTTPSEGACPAPATLPLPVPVPLAAAGAVGTCPSPEYLGRSLTGRSVSHDSVFTSEAAPPSRQSSERSASPAASDSAHSLHQLGAPTKTAAAVAVSISNWEGGFFYLSAPFAVSGVVRTVFLLFFKIDRRSAIAYNSEGLDVSF